MRLSFLSLAPVALLAMSACNNSDNAAEPEAEATPATAEAPIELPPSIVDSGVYRCADSSVVYVDFYQGGKRAGIRTEQNGQPIILNAPEADMASSEATPEAGATPEAAATPETGDLTLTGGDGYALKGTGQTIEVQLPGKEMQTCKSS